MLRQRSTCACVVFAVILYRQKSYTTFTSALVPYYSLEAEMIENERDSAHQNPATISNSSTKETGGHWRRDLACPYTISAFWETLKHLTESLLLNLTRLYRIKLSAKGHREDD